MDLTGIDFGALTIPVFSAIFGAGWTAHGIFVGRPREKRLADLEARDVEYRKSVDEELRMLRQKVHG